MKDDGKKRGRPRDEKARARVLKAALRIVRAEGLGAATVERIAHEAGVGKQTIYRWWPSRAHVLLDALKSFVEQVVHIPDTGTFATDLLGLAQANDKAASAQLLPLMRALVAEGVADQDFMALFKRDYLDARRQKARLIFERAAARGEIEAGDIETLLDTYYGMLWLRILFETGPADHQAAASIARAVSGAGKALAKREARE